MRQGCKSVSILKSNISNLKRKTQEDEAIGGCRAAGPGHSWQFTVGSKQFNLETANSKLQLKKRSPVAQFG